VAATALLVRGPTVETTLKEAEKLNAELIVVVPVRDACSWRSTVVSWRR